MNTPRMEKAVHRYAANSIVTASLVAALLVAACNDTATESEPNRQETASLAVSARSEKPEVGVVSCEDYYEIDTPMGRLENNVWNKQAIGDSPYRQCLLAGGDASAREYGWSWEWPSQSHSVVAYPEVVVGWKPWVGGASTHPNLPIRVDAIRAMQWTYVMETEASGRHNLATSLWLTRTGQTGTDPNPDDISTELMIWTDGFSFPPAGTRLGNSTIGGIDYEVWFGADWGDASGASSNRWNYLAYRATEKKLAASIDLKQILHDAVERKIVSPSHYVANVEIGNEIMSGSGTTWIKELALDVQ